MAMTGLVDKLLMASDSDWVNYQDIAKSPLSQRYGEGLSITNTIFKDIGKSNNLDLIIHSEELMVLRERELHGKNDPSVMPSLNAAVADFNVIKSSVSTVKDPEAYQAAATTYHAKKKTQGVVTDGCHEAINGHITRLGNRMSAVGVSVPEKNVLRQRQANMRTAKELYIDLQKIALGIDTPAKEKGLER